MKHGRLVKALLAIVAIGFLVYYVDPEAMASAAAGASPWWIAAAVLLLPANVFLEGSVWHLLIRRVDPTMTRRESFGALFTGYALGFFTPGRAGEFAGRAFHVRHHDKWEVAAVVAVQRLYDMAVVVSLGTAALILFQRTRSLPPEGLWTIVAAAGALIGATLVSAALAPKSAHRIAVRLLPFETWRRRIGFLARLTTADGVRVVGLDAARFAIYSTQFFLLLRALVPAADPAAGYLGIGLVFLAKFLIPSITFMDLGIREGAAVFFLGRMGFAEAAALNASLLLFAINLLLPAAIGIRFVMKMRLSAAPDERLPQAGDCAQP